jgi:UDP-N-acetylglucosamine 4-epimerase
MSKYDEVQADISRKPRHWLVTGVAGFIGSNLLEKLLLLGQHVAGLDNFSTGRERNLEDVRGSVTAEQWSRFKFVRGDICNFADCQSAHAALEGGVDYVLHQAALGSVPRSLADPPATHRANTDGFLNMLIASRDAKVKQFVYASSSSVYGDHPALPKREETIGRPISPYAVTKLVDELYAGVFHRCYGLRSIGLRYFNVFGKRQDPNGAYAAVIPKWFGQIFRDSPICIYGNGETSRDFCYIDNVVQANILAALASIEEGSGHVFNVACGERHTLNKLYSLIQEAVLRRFPEKTRKAPEYQPERAGDVQHSHADISKAEKLLGYCPSFKLAAGLELTCDGFSRVLGGTA